MTLPEYHNTGLIQPVKEMINVLIVSHYWTPHVGGVEVVANKQANYLASHGCSVSVLTSSAGCKGTEHDPENISVERIKVFNWLERFGIPYPIFSVKLLLKTCQMVKNADVLIIHDSVYMNCALATIIGKLQNKPSVLIQHSPYVKYKFPWGFIKWCADRSLGKITYSLSTTLCAVSQYTFCFMRQFVKDREVKILHNGVSLSKFSVPTPVKSIKNLREKLLINDDQFVVLSVRRLVERNGLDLLIECARKLKTTNNISFVIVGDGPLRADILAQIDKYRLNNVHLAGFVKDSELARYYHMCDLYVLPSVSGEGFGLTVLESFACSKPVITFSGFGPDDIIDDCLNGFLLDQMDAVTLSEKILYLFENSDVVDRMAENAIKKARIMTWDVNGRKLLRIIQDTLVKKNNASRELI